MIEPEIRASEVRVLLPDIRLERSECAAQTWVPSCLHTWETGELRSPDKVIGNKGRTDVDLRPCKGVSELRPSRISFVELWEAKIHRSVMEGEAVGCHNFSGCDQYRVFLTITE
jgi:hypothetical protein